MSHDHFQLIMIFFHFNDNSTYNPSDENCDHLHKAQPLIDALCERCQTIYYPWQNRIFDELFVLFKGRLHFKQFICIKRWCFGIKFYELCSSSGITLDFLAYCGKGMFSDDDPYYDMPSSERIPSILTQPFLRKGHTLYTYNYYTSPSLEKFLLENKTHLCGTIRSNWQNYPKELVNAQLSKGDAAFFQCENPKMVACKYCAPKVKTSGKQKVVYMLSTCHQPDMTDIKIGDQTGRKWICIKYYNHMGGVGKVDQQLYYQHSLRKSYKW